PGPFVSSLPRPDGQQDSTGRLQTGFKFGGPLRKDRAFYFAAYEHQQSDEVTPFTGVGRDGLAGGWDVAANRDDNVFVRTDFTLRPSQLLMVRLSGDDRRTEDLNVGGNTTPETGFHLDEQDAQLAASLTSIVSSRLLNEVRLLAGTSAFDQFANSDRPGVERPSGSFGGNNLNRQNRHERRAEIVDNLTFSSGGHTMKFGVDLSRSITRVATRFNPNFNFLYDTDQPFEPGDCGDIIASQVASARLDPSFDPHTTPIPCPGIPDFDDDGDGTIDEPGFIGTYPFVFQYIKGKPKATLADTRLALFAQDSWQATPRLLVDYGLRYDVSTFRLPSATRIDSKIPNGGAGRDADNIGPRLGFSFTPSASGRLVLRGGAGIFFDKLVLGFPAVAAITSGTQIGLLFPQGLTFEITEDVVEQYGARAFKKGLIFPENLVLRFSTGTRLDTPYTVQYSL
ncbi:MAG: hypothetical protein ACREDF_03830, partial [Thermoplasmata archaeon]